MQLLDMRTIIHSYALTNAVCAAVMVLLWRQNRQRFAGLTFWLADFGLQWAGMLLIALRGHVPDFLSIVVSNTFIVVGTWLLYIGLERFAGKASPQLHNFVLLAVFIAVHIYFAFGQPSLAARTINLSLALLVLCFQSAWLLLYRVEADLRPIARGVGYFLAAYCLASLARMGVELVAPPGNDFFQAGPIEIAPILLNQLLFIGLTFFLFLMVNHRLFAEIQRLASFPELNPNPVLALDLDGALMFFNPAAAAVAERARAHLDVQAFIPPDTPDILQKLAQGEEANVYREVQLGDAIFGEDIYLLPRFAAAHIYARDLTLPRRAEEARQHAEAALRENEHWLRTLIDHTPTYVSYLDRNRCYRFVNQRYADSFGRPLETMVGQPYRDVVGEAYYQASVKNIEKAFAGQSLAFETSINLPVSGKRWLIVSYVPDVDEQDAVKGIFVVGYDITERKQAEAALHASEAHYRALIEGTPGIVYVFSSQKGGVYYSPWVTDLLGYSPDELTAQPWLWHHSIHPDDLSGVDQSLREATAGRLFCIEYRLRDAAGQWRWLEDRSIASHVDGAEVVIEGLALDITARKQAETEIRQLNERLELRVAERTAELERANRELRGEMAARRQVEAALRESERHYRTIFENSMEAILFTAPDGQVFEANPAACRMLGRSVEEICAVGRIGIMDEADPRLAQALEARRQTGRFSGELTYLRRDGTPFPVEIISTLLDEPGGQQRTTVFIRDITERKQAEAAMQASEARLRAYIDYAPEGIWNTDATGKFSDANPAACALLGYTRDELLKQNLFDLIGPEGLTATAGLGGLAEGEVLSGELPLRHREGTLLTVFHNTVRLPGGDRVSFCADITARKLAEREHAASLELLQLIQASGDSRTLINTVIVFFHVWSGCEAVGIRLHEGEDYPYFEVRGFPDSHVLTENQLCVVDAHGAVVRDSAGNPVLECMCGNILCGRFDPARPFFTAHGSFWSNNTTQLLATTTDEDRQTRTRNRCNGEGYESVALLPLRAGMETLGLVQLNDKRPGRFTPELIGQLERLADHVANTLAKQRAEEALRDSEARYRTLAAENARLLEISRQEATTKATLLHEVNHRVKNNLSAIIGLLYLEQQYLRAEDQAPYQALVQDLTSRIRSLAVVHSLLSAVTWAPISLTDLALQVVQAAQAILPRQRAIQIDVSPSPVRLAPKQANALGLILNELATNAFKHAMRETGRIHLSVRVSETADEISLDFHDNGPGFPEDILRGSRRSVGLYLIESLAEGELRGTVTLHNHDGARVCLRFNRAIEDASTLPALTYT